VEELRPQDVVTAYGRYKARERSRQSMATANWPTVLAHECEAYAFYNRTVPGERRRKIGEGLAMIFSEGNDQARMVKRDLIDAGFEVSGEEEQMTWPKYQISGRRDLVLWKDGFKEKVRVEVKSTSPWTFDAINKPEDIQNATKDWLVKWWKQVALYMILQSVEKYWLLMKNKQNGNIKIIEFTMNDDIYNAAEVMLKKAERVNRMVQIGEFPSKEQKVSDADICAECPFFDACLPDLAFGPGAAILTDEEATELAAQLDRREELTPAHKEYESIDEEVKGSIKALALGGIDKVVAEDWICTVKEQSRKAFSVAASTFKKISFVRQKEKA
jgi:CRISPR/Cas system-associated exonuclease Cas4 (RecB family)